MERETMKRRPKSNNNVKKQFLKNQKNLVQKRLCHRPVQDLDLMLSHNQVIARKMEKVAYHRTTRCTTCF